MDKKFTSAVRSIIPITMREYRLRNEQLFDQEKQNYITILDDTYEKIPEKIEGIHTILTPFQRTSVAAMLDVIEKQYVNFEDRNGRGRIFSNAFALSDEMGVGKTVEILALITMLKDREIKNFDYKLINHDSMYKKTTDKKTANIGHQGYIKRTYKKVNNAFLIFVSVSVFQQWIDAIETFSDLRYLGVVDVHGIEKLFASVEDGSISEYDIIIVKNGNITRGVKFPDGTEKLRQNLKTTPFIYNYVANLNMTWKGVVIDDFDNVPIPPNPVNPRGLIYIYVSSTTRIESEQSHSNNQFLKTSDMLKYDFTDLGTITRNLNIFTAFNIRNDHQFIMNHNNLTKPVIYVGIFHNPHEQVSKLIDSFSSDKTVKLMEMINSGAIETAAELVGIKTNSVADIFEKLLHENFIAYKKAISVIKFIDENYDSDKLPAEMIPSEKEDPDHTYNREHLFSYKVPKYKYPNVRQLMREVKEEQEKILKTSDASIRRVKDNIIADSCPICMNSFKETNRNVVVCRKCSVMGCSDCIMYTASMYSVGNKIKGRCPACRQEILITDVIFIPNNIDLETIVDKKVAVEEEIKERVVIDEHDIDDPSKRTKISALVDIFNGKMPPEFMKKDITIARLQEGKDVFVKTPRPWIKILLFTSFDESEKKITKALEARKIPYWKLSGGANSINKTSKLFNIHQGPAVLLINSSKYCAGLNLQSADWILFDHKIRQPEIESQIAGRAQRLGRDCTLQIGYMLYENETAHI